ncbi:hypothetical protein ACSNOD_06350, partial [Streptomyces sp. URMC 123]
ASRVQNQGPKSSRPTRSKPPTAAARPGGRPGRFIDTVGRLLCADPQTVQPLLCRWFDDDRPLHAAPVPLTVAAAAQALLHTHRHRAVDDLAEALVDAAHPRADELLAALAEDEPSAVCRAIDRWAHDERVERHVAAAAYGLLAAPHVRTAADREILRYAALAMLARPTDCTLHGAALALLVLDPDSRARHLPQALDRFAAGDPHLPPKALAPALDSHPDAVLAAFRSRLAEAAEGAEGGVVGEVLDTLAQVRTPALARRVATLVREHVASRPADAVHAAAYVDRRLEHGPEARAVLFPLVSALLRNHPPQVRCAFAPVLAAPGTRISRPLRQELLEVLLEHEEFGRQERDPAVLDALLSAVARASARRPEVRTRDLVHRTGMLLVRTPEGAACFDRRIVELAREVPGFARLVRRWLGSAPAEWAPVVGPGARAMVETLAEEGPGRPARRPAGAPGLAGPAPRTLPDVRTDGAWGSDARTDEAWGSGLRTDGGGGTDDRTDEGPGASARTNGGQEADARTAVDPRAAVELRTPGAGSASGSRSGAAGPPIPAARCAPPARLVPPPPGGTAELAPPTARDHAAQPLPPAGTDTDAGRRHPAWQS